MNIEIFFQRVSYLNKLIKKGKTGTPDKLAEDLGIAPRTIFHYLKMMREELGAPIFYDEQKKTYRYSKKGEIPLTFITEKKKKK